MDDNYPRFDEFLALAGDQISDEGRQWIEVMPTADKARNGSWFFTITDDDLEVFAESIRLNPSKIPVDYDHEGAGTGSTRAAGWYTGQAEVRKNGAAQRLFAEVEWTPKAQQEIKDGEFRFISPEFSFNEKDPKSGLMTKAKQLIASTLTNRPFFRELAPVASLLDDDEVTALSDKYGEDVTEILLAALSGDANKIRAALKPETDDEGTPLDTEGDETVDYIKALGLDENADASKKVAAALNQKEEQILGLQAEITELKAAQGEAVKLTERIAELEVRDRKRDVEVILSKAVETGRCLPAEKDTLAELFVDNVPGLRTLIAGRPAGMYGQHKEIGSGGKGVSFDDPDTVALAKEMGVKDEPLDEESAQLHIRAVAILRENGKASEYTADEYMSAIDEAQRVGAYS